MYVYIYIYIYIFSLRQCGGGEDDGAEILSCLNIYTLDIHVYIYIMQIIICLII